MQLSIGPIVFFVWVAIVIILSLKKRRHLSGRKLALIRALFASWRFFDHVGRVPKLYYRIRPGQQVEFEPWNYLFPKTERTPFSLFINSSGNTVFAYHSLVEQFIQDMNEYDADGEGFQASVSYRLVQRMVTKLIENKIGPGDVFQFKLTVTSWGSNVCDEDIMISLEHEAGNLC